MSSSSKQTGPLSSENVSELNFSTEKDHLKSSTISRTFNILLLGFCSFGSYYSKDVINALQKQIREEFNLSHQQYTLLYTFPSIPNIIMSFLGGFIIDVLGSTNSICLFAGLVFMGSLFVFFGAGFENLPLVYLGQITMGIGKASLISSQKVIYTWMEPEYLALALSLSLSISHLGTYLSFVLSPIFSTNFSFYTVETEQVPTGNNTINTMQDTSDFKEKWKNVANATIISFKENQEESKENDDNQTNHVFIACNGLMIATLMCFFSFLLTLYIQQKFSDPISTSTRTDKKTLQSSNSIQEGSMLSYDYDTKGFLQNDVKVEVEEIDMDLSNEEEIELLTLDRRESSCVSFFPNKITRCFSMLFYRTKKLCLNRQYLYLTLTILCFYDAFFTFEALSIDFLETEGGQSNKSASWWTSVLTMTSVVFGPLIGLWIDRNKKVQIELNKRKYNVILDDMPIEGRHEIEEDMKKKIGINNNFENDTTDQDSVVVGGNLDGKHLTSNLVMNQMKNETTPLVAQNLMYSLLVVGLAFALFAYLLLSTVESSPSTTKIFVALSLLGSSFTIVPAVLWPLVSICSTSDIIGLAYGLIHAADDLFQLLSTVLFGYLVDRGVSYVPSLFLILAALTVIGILSCVLLIFENRKEQFSSEKGKG